MTRQPFGLVGFTTAYAFSILGTVLVLLLHDEWAQVDIRTWSPLMQIIVTSFGIVAAFYVQGWKRKGDREEAERDTFTQIHYSGFAIELDSVMMRDRCRAGELTPLRIQLQKPILQASVARLQAANVSHLHGVSATVAYLAFLNDVIGYVAVLESLDKPGIVVPPDRLDAMYKRIFDTRTVLLKALKLTPGPNRHLRAP